MPIDTRRVEPVETIYVVHHTHTDVGFTNDCDLFGSHQEELTVHHGSVEVVMSPRQMMTIELR